MPKAVTVNVALLPCTTVWLCGWLVIAGGFEVFSDEILKSFITPMCCIPEAPESPIVTGETSVNGV